MGTIQFIQITPEEQQAAIVAAIWSKVETLKKDFQPKEPTEFMTRKQVTEFLDIDLSTLHNWTKKGKLKAYGIAGRVYYKRAEVEAAIKPLEV